MPPFLKIKDKSKSNVIPSEAEESTHFPPSAQEIGAKIPPCGFALVGMTVFWFCVSFAAA
jgi:hypothetical protein